MNFNDLFESNLKAKSAPLRLNHMAIFSKKQVTIKAHQACRSRVLGQSRSHFWDVSMLHSGYDCPLYFLFIKTHQHTGIITGLLSAEKEEEKLATATRQLPHLTRRSLRRSQVLIHNYCCCCCCKGNCGRIMSLLLLLPKSRILRQLLLYRKEPRRKRRSL